MKSMIVTLALASTLVIAAKGQQQTDTVIVSLGKTSKVIFTIQDRSDLEILKHYNFQDLFQDIITRLEQNDTAATSSALADHTEPEPEVKEEERASDETKEEEQWTSRSRHDDQEDKEWEEKIERRRTRIGRTWQSFNFDLGTNNYVADGEFPDADNALYSVRPWGSWYVAGSTIQRTRLGRNFFVEWGLGVSWYNFKFQNDNVLIVKDDDGVEFVEDVRDVNHQKSKLTATFVNASFVPVLDFGGHSRKPRMWDGYGSSFRIGIGPYVGYRVGSRSKIVYTEDGDREKDKERNSFYLNNLRYGARVQLGFHGTDLFFNYDMNELFTSGKGPKLNAFSFGVIF
jgi:hypothetical protein